MHILYNLVEFYSLSYWCLHFIFSTQIDTLRHVIVTENREKTMRKGIDFASSGGQADSGFMMFNTSSGNNIIFQLPSKISSGISVVSFTEHNYF